MIGWLRRWLDRLDRDAFDEARWRRIEAEAAAITARLGSGVARERAAGAGARVPPFLARQGNGQDAGQIGLHPVLAPARRTEP